MGLVSGDQKGGDHGFTEIGGEKDNLGIRELGESGVSKHKDQPGRDNKSQSNHEESILPDSQLDIRRLLPPEEDPGALGNSGL